ncbi:MAG: outer membrane protein assembly factor BamA [Pseudomonadota bacterium]|nr:outer membrane protein assembly factor BamA [Pseudomonadota bacterium]
MSFTLLAALLVPAVYAEAPAPVAGTVSEVRVTGLRRVEEAALLDVVRLRAGEPLEDWKIERDMRAIWATGFVDDVVVRTVPGAGDSVIVLFDVHEKPAVRAVKIAGAKKIKEDDLKEAIDIEPFTVPSDGRIASNVKAIKDKYLEKGFFLAEVEPVITPVGDDLVEITFKVTEGRKVIVQTIDITGNENVPDAKLRKFMQTKAGGILPWLTSSGTFIQDALDNDVYILRSVFLEEGYVDAQVDQPKVFLSPDKRYIYVTIHVNEGPRYRLGKVTVQGDFVPEEGLTEGAVRALIEGKDLSDVQEAYKRDVAAGQKIGPDWEPDVQRRALDFRPENQPLRTGDWFKLTTLQNTMGRITDLYGDQGYAFANASPVPQPDPEARVVDVVIDVQRGEKMKVGRVNITGNDPTFDKVVRREVPINEGETYRGSAVREARERLERLGFFESPVEVSTPRAEEPGVLDLNINVTERPTGSFSVGAGYGSADSFLLTANIQKANFLGMGWVVSLAGNISARTKQGNVSFFDPHFLDSQWTLRVDGFYNQREYIENEYQRGGSVSVGRYLDKRDDIRVALDYTLEDVGLVSLDEYKERLLGGQLYRNGLTSSLGVSIDIDKRNNRINATRGFKASLSTELAGGFRINDQETLSLFGGDFNFWETKANFRFYQPVIAKNDWLVFKYNGSFGHIQSTDGSIIPYIHRYRAGGILSVRGYDPYSLGPAIRASGYKPSDPRSSVQGSDDPAAADDRLVVGGVNTWINNFELESPIIKSAGISVVAFFDAGNTFGDPWGQGAINPLDLRFAYGVGVRWFSPIGPLRFEYGFPINPREDERKAVFDFTIGSSF